MLPSDGQDTEYSHGRARHLLRGFFAVSAAFYPLLPSAWHFEPQEHASAPVAGAVLHVKRWKKHIGNIAQLATLTAVSGSIPEDRLPISLTGTSSERFKTVFWREHLCKLE